MFKIHQQWNYILGLLCRFWLSAVCSFSHMPQIYVTDARGTCTTTLCRSQSSGLTLRHWRVIEALSPKQAVFGTGSKEGKDLHSYRKKRKETKFWGTDGNYVHASPVPANLMQIRKLIVSPEDWNVIFGVALMTMVKEKKPLVCSGSSEYGYGPIITEDTQIPVGHQWQLLKFPIDTGAQ